jgi:DMSO/TMAO reductase YedYZ molybdopterin-dependent catalytic subunit
MVPAGDARIPPGQRLVTDFPVLHAGSVMHVDKKAWRLSVTGLMDFPFTLDWNALLALDAVEQTSDIHCVTGWTKLDTQWKGVRVSTLLEGRKLPPSVEHAVIHATGAWTTNLPVEELLRDDVLIAYEYEGRPISAEHGGPARLIVPRLYFWKSAKWLSGIEFTHDQRLGYWERLGYHAVGDPWLEQRYS